jgi:hypothetical protein
MVERDLRKVEMAVRFRLAPKFGIKRFYPFSLRQGKRSILLFDLRVTLSLLRCVSPSGDQLKMRILVYKVFAKYIPFDRVMRKIDSPALTMAA